MKPPLPGHRPSLLCTECRQPLSALRARQRTVCERPACLQQADARETRAARGAAAARLQQDLAGTLGPARAAALTVLWIRPHEAQAQPLPPALREQLQQHLLGLADSEGAGDSPPAELASQAGPVSTAEWALCGWCGGRCCRYGGEENGYIRLNHLRRWQQDHPGSTLHDAAQAYIDRLPEQHVASSCAFHGLQGCTLDRTMRSEVCNRFACDGLRELQLQVASTADVGAGAQAGWLFVQGRRAEPLATRLHLPGAAGEP